MLEQQNLEFSEWSHEFDIEFQVKFKNLKNSAFSKLISSAFQCFVWFEKILKIYIDILFALSGDLKRRHSWSSEIDYQPAETEAVATPGGDPAAPSSDDEDRVSYKVSLPIIMKIYSWNTCITYIYKCLNSVHTWYKQCIFCFHETTTAPNLVSRSN